MGQNAIYYKGKSYSGGGGGGTEVIANPEDAATDTLTKLSVDGDVYGIKSYQEITKAEYDALPSSKLTDDILYCITDGGATEPGEYFNPVIYSLTEREVGVWTDGRPLYQRTYTFKFTDLENKTISSSILKGNYALPHEEYERIWIYDGLIKCVPKAEGGASETSLKGTALNYSAGSTYTRTNIQRNPNFNDSYPFIFIENTYGTSELYKIVNDLDVYVVLRYTKTTDTPGSGKYTTLGVPSVHYSTDEQVIGTWIDGKTLYQKTLRLTSGIVTGSFQTIPLDSTCIVNNYQGFVRRTDKRVDNFNGFVQTTDALLLSARTNGMEYFIATRFTDITELCITVQYTKTTD